MSNSTQFPAGWYVVSPRLSADPQTKSTSKQPSRQFASLQSSFNGTLVRRLEHPERELKNSLFDIERFWRLGLASNTVGEDFGRVSTLWKVTIPQCAKTDQTTVSKSEFRVEGVPDVVSTRSA